MTDQDDRLVIRMNNTLVRCLTVVIVTLFVGLFGSCLYHCERQADRRFRCIELIRDVEKCSDSFEWNR